MKAEVRRAEPVDAVELAPNLRAADKFEIASYTGLPPITELLRPFAAPDPKQIYSIVADEKVIGMFGVAPNKGDLELLRELLTNTPPAQIVYEMAVVQPGISATSLSEKLSNVLGAANEYLLNGGLAKLRWIGS